ncbi:MAG: amidase [Bdellovibrionaceae bacterium]|nr:amidase [Pseudobdellovibrionaceae bacterium]
MSRDLRFLLEKSASDIAALIRAKEISPSEAVETHIQKVREVNPSLNAVTEERFEQATREAAEQTRQLASVNPDELPPFFGVPYTAKEIFAIKGMRQTAGSIHRRNHISDFDATVVTRMRNAGAVLLATTNVPELGFWFECENPVYGRTNNPYDPSRTSGGSSGGEGALIGAGASPLGLGSDIGGSIRMPAGFCGVFGHKPTRHRVPLTGHFPFSLKDMEALTGEMYPYTCSGLLTRRAKDLSPFLNAIAGPDQIDREIHPRPSVSNRPFDLVGKKVFVCRDPIFHLAKRADDDVQEAVKKAARLLEQRGAVIEEFDPHFFVRAVELWFASIRSPQSKSFNELLSPENPIAFGREMLKTFRGSSSYTVPSLFTALLEKLATGKRDQNTPALLAEAKELRLRFEKLLGTDGLLLFPTHPRVAPKHRAPWLSPFDFIYTAIFNVFEGPATACPVGLSGDGLPLSVQVIANPDRDDLTMAVAEILEDGFGGWTPATHP